MNGLALPLVVAFSFVAAVVGFAVCATWSPKPAPARTLLVAVDLATGTGRALDAVGDEHLCLGILHDLDEVIRQRFEVKRTERLDCWAPK